MREIISRIYLIKVSNVPNNIFLYTYFQDLFYFEIKQVKRKKLNNYVIYFNYFITDLFSLLFLFFGKSFEIFFLLQIYLFARSSMHNIRSVGHNSLSR